MKRWLIIPLTLFIFGAWQLAHAQNNDELISKIPKHVPTACNPDGTQASGAIYRICMPNTWNGELVIFAHGYVSPLEPVAIPEDQLSAGGVSLADAVNFLGYGFATTSYSKNGLAVQEGMADIVDLVDIFIAEQGQPSRIYLIGASEGGIITALALENYPTLFTGGMAICGPYGSFDWQANYLGDARVLFDYYFPSLLPESPINIPDSLINDWDNVYQNNILPEITSSENVTAVHNYLNTFPAPYEETYPISNTTTIEDLLWYNVFSTNDATVVLGGQPYDNNNTIYTGSPDDKMLNNGVARFTADSSASLQLYNTTGQLFRPLLTMHTTRDPIVPYEHVDMYQEKIMANNRQAFYQHIEIDRYGHCNFTASELLGGFANLRGMVDEQTMIYLPIMVKN